MPAKRKLGKRLLRSLLPIVLVILVAVLVALSFVVYCISRPAKSAYLVTPQSFSQISSPALKVTDETWTNRDGTRARGWLLRGAAGAPAVVLLHRYGADRSYSFNLGVKINETTSFTILWPDVEEGDTRSGSLREDPVSKLSAVAIAVAEGPGSLPYATFSFAAINC